MLAYLNGSFLPESDAKLSIKDRGWLYGDGIFETMRTYGGRIFKLSEHLARLERSATLVGITAQPSRKELEAIVKELLVREHPDRDIVIRVTISRGVGGPLWPTEPLEPTIVAQLREMPRYPDEVFTLGWSMITAKTRRNSPSSIDPQIKSTNFLNNILAKREAAVAGANEALMLNHQGYVAESSVSNFFMVREGRVITPPTSVGILPGITRELVLEICAAAGLPARAEAFRVEDVRQADEAFLTLTSAGLIPVVSLDDRPIGGGKPGPMVARIRALYNDYVTAFQRGEN